MKNIYLGYEVDDLGIRVNQNKVKAILGFPEPRNADPIRSFLGLAGYYRQFVPQISAKVAPLTRLLWKSAHFEWGAKKEESFRILKEGVTTSPVLAFSDLLKPYYCIRSRLRYCVSSTC